MLFSFRNRWALIKYFLSCLPHLRISPVLTMTTQAPQLTTTFTPDKSCFQYFKYRYTGTDRTCKEGGTGTPSACTYLQLGPSESDAGCFPSSLELGTTFYYSPGICPSGFEVACSSTLDDGETRATCCPRYESKLIVTQGPC